MPYINGLALTKILQVQYPNLKILILSMYNEERFIKEFKDAGASGYLTKTTEIDEVKNSILTIMAGGNIFPQLASDIESIHNQDLFLKKFSLSIREKEVVDLMMKGLGTRQISEILFISYYTAETHRKNIYTKLGIKGGERSLVNLINIQTD
jgi:DNA-binding NarL/FixJ family response regulator